MLRQPVLIVFVAIVLGILLADISAMGTTFALCACIAALGWVIVAWKTRRGLALASLLTLLLCGALSTSRVHKPATIVASCSNTQPSIWRGIIDGPVSRGRAFFKTTQGPQRTFLRDLEEQCGALWHGRPGRLRVTLAATPPVARGDQITARLTLRPITAARNPVGPDPLVDARRMSIGAWASARGQHAIMHRGTGLLASIDRARTTVTHFFDSHLPMRDATLAKALALGDRGTVTPQMRERWADAGIAHLLAISGLHVGIVAMLLYLLVRRFCGWLPQMADRFSLRRIAALCSIPSVIFFCLWVGAPPSAVRATVMAVAVFLGWVLGHPNAAPNALGMAGAALVLWDPTSIYDVGFLLSFAAVAALMMAPRLPHPKNLWQTLLFSALGTCLASLIATLATAPITAYYFGRISWIAPLTNMVAIPIGAFVATPLSLLGALCAVTFPKGAFANTILWLGQQSYALLDGVANWGASFGALDVPKPNGLEIGLYIAIPCLIMLRKKIRHPRWVMAACAVCVLCLMLSAGMRIIKRCGDGQLHVLHPYVGQGDAAIVLFPQGSVMMFDAGGTLDAMASDPGRNIIAPLLRMHLIRTIDIAVVSHPHPDHLNGFGYLSEHFNIRELWWTGEGGELPVMQRLLHRVRHTGGKIRLIAHLPKEQNIEGVTLRVIHPRPGEQAEGLTYYPELSANNNSAVMQLRFGSRTALLPGDIETESEQRLVDQIGATDLLRAPHHGSATSSSLNFIRGLNPKSVLISCGHHNRFGFPAPDVLHRYQQQGVRIFRSDQDGYLQWHTDGHSWVIQSHRGSRFVVQ